MQLKKIAAFLIMRSARWVRKNHIPDMFILDLRHFDLIGFGCAPEEFQAKRVCDIHTHRMNKEKILHSKKTSNQQKWPTIFFYKNKQNTKKNIKSFLSAF